MKLKFKTYDYLANVWEYAEAHDGNYHIRYGLMKLAKDWSCSLRIWHTDPKTGMRSEVGYATSEQVKKRDGQAWVMDELTNQMKNLQIMNA
tara:strand:+ start:486 stop:758 length:273 start_codon:yes stop_codon:yes gene_type:complete